MDDDFLNAYKRARANRPSQQPIVQTATPKDPVEASEVVEQPSELIPPVSTETVTPVQVAPEVSSVVPQSDKPPIPDNQPEEPSLAEPAMPIAESVPATSEPTEEKVANEPPALPQTFHANVPAAPSLPTEPSVTLLDNGPLTVSTQMSPSRSKFSSYYAAFLFFLGGLVVVGLLLFYFWRNPAILGLKTVKSATNGQTQASSKDQTLANQYIAELKQLAEIPPNETPTVATITDVNKLKQSQSFFNKAQNGDILIIYSTKAFILDPNKKVIVDSAPVHLNNRSNLSQTEATNAANILSVSANSTPTPTPTLRPLPQAQTTATSSASVQP